MATPPFSAVTFHDGRFSATQIAGQDTALVKKNNEEQPLAEQQTAEEPPLKIDETGLPTGENNVQMPPKDGEDPILSLSEPVFEKRAAVLAVMQGNDSLARESHPNRKQTSEIPNTAENVQSDVSPDVAMPDSDRVPENRTSPGTFDLVQFGANLLQGGIRWLTEIGESDPLEPSNAAVHMDTQPAVDGIDYSIQPVISMATPTSSASSSTQTTLSPPALENPEPNAAPTLQSIVAICPPQVNLLDESTWQAMPSTRPSLTAAALSQPHLKSPQSLAVEVTSRELLEGGYTLDKTVRTGFQGNPELLQSAVSAMTALRTKPSGNTFSVITKSGQRKEYYRAQFTMSDLVSAGRKLAAGCSYGDDITVSVEKYSEDNDLAYACITFRKRMDHAQETYRELCAQWNIRVQRPLTFASPMGIFGSLRADTPQTIRALEEQRSRVFDDFVAACYAQNVPKDPALQAIYRPTHEQRRAFLGNCPEYIAATDCVMFTYEPVPHKRTTSARSSSLSTGGKAPSASTTTNTQCGNTSDEYSI